MTLGPSTKTQYGVARGDDIISDGYDTVPQARQQLAHVEETMRGVGLEPDVHLVEVVVKTTIGRAKPYREPNPIDEPSTPASSESGAEGSTPSE